MATRPDRLTPRWLTFVALSLLFFLVSAGTFSSLGVVLPVMVTDLHMSWTQAGMGYTFLGLACGLASPAPAVMIRRIGVRGTLAAGSALLICGFGLLALARNAQMYLAATLLVGIAFALTTTVPGTHVLTGLYRRRATALGAYFTIGALGQVAGPLLYVAIVGAHMDWRSYWWAFVIASAAVGALAAAVATGAREPAADLAPTAAAAPGRLVGHPDWTVQRALATPQIYVIFGAYTMYLLINTTAHGFAVAHLTERGVSAKDAAGMLSLEALIGAVLSVVGGVIGEKVRAKTLLIVALVGVIAGMAALALAQGYALMLVYAVGVGVGYGLTPLAATLLLLAYFGKRPNLELYSLMCLISTSAAIGPVLGGWARDTVGSFAGMFLLSAGATFAMLVATLFLTPPGKSAAAQPETAT